MTDLTAPTAHFGTRLRQRRTSAGLSQAELAGDVLSASYVSLLESGKREPSTEVVRMLADRLNCEPTDLTTAAADEHRRRIELELAYARLARKHGEAATAVPGLEALLADPGLDRGTRDQVCYELAVTHYVLGAFDPAAELLVPLLERGLAGAGTLPITQLGVAACGCLIDTGDARAAFRLGERALALAVEHGHEGTDEYLRLAATVLDAQFLTGELTAAAVQARRLTELALRAGGPDGQGALLWNAALIAEARGRLDEALTLARRALGLLGEQGDTRDLARLQSDLAGLLLDAGPGYAREVQALLDAAHSPLAGCSPVDLAGWEIQRARLELDLGRPEAAATLARQCAQRLAIYPVPEAARARIVLGDCLVGLGQPDRAVTEYHTAAALVESLPPSRQHAMLWRDLAERASAHDSPDRALSAYRRALDLAGVPARTPLRRAGLSTGTDPGPTAPAPGVVPVDAARLPVDAASLPVAAPSTTG